MTKWAHKILDSKGGLIYVYSTFPDGRKAFYYMLSTPSNSKILFEEMKKEQLVDLKKYGKIVRSGWGEPTEEDKEFMRKNHKAVV